MEEEFTVFTLGMRKMEGMTTIFNVWIREVPSLGRRWRRKPPSSSSLGSSRFSIKYRKSRETSGGGDGGETERERERERESTKNTQRMA